MQFIIWQIWQFRILHPRKYNKINLILPPCIYTNSKLMNLPSEYNQKFVQNFPICEDWDEENKKKRWEKRFLFYLKMAISIPNLVK